MLELLRKESLGEEFDYQFLTSKLQGYRYTRNVINRLLKTGKIIRVKKGLYVFGENYRREPISRTLLANLIYGPSYVSREYALGYYGLIPERVEEVTSMTIQKNKEFETPIGRFHYKHINPVAYTVGVDRFLLDNHRYFFIASREKALADLIALQKGINNENEMLEHLLKNLRIDEDDLTSLDIERLKKVAAAYKKPIVNLLYNTLKHVILMRYPRPH